MKPLRSEKVDSDVAAAKTIVPPAGCETGLQLGPWPQWMIDWAIKVLSEHDPEYLR